MLRHCANALSAVLLAGFLVACSSSSTVREAAEEPVAVTAGDEPAVDADAAPVPFDGAVEAAAGESSEYVIDYSIEANLDEITERTQRVYDEALAAMRSGDWLQAELALEGLISEEPGFPGPWVNLAVIYERDGRTGEARQALEQALAFAPDFAPANNALGRMLRVQGEFAAAEFAYRRALASDPNNVIAHLNLGILLDVYLRRPTEALEHYNQYQAMQAEPDEVVARWIIDLERRAAAAERVAQD